MENNIFSDKQIEYMYSNGSFLRFVNDYFSSFLIQNQDISLRLGEGTVSNQDLNIYMRIILGNLSELRTMISGIERSLSYTFVGSTKVFDGEIHGHLQIQEYLKTRTQIKFPKEYPCQIKVRSLITPENLYVLYIIDYVLKMLFKFERAIREYKGNNISTEKGLIDEYKRVFKSFYQKNYFKECRNELYNIQKTFGDEFPNELLNSIRIRKQKGRIRNYIAYESIFKWFLNFRKGKILLDVDQTIKISRYSDDFCNRLFELWCLHSLKETFINEFGMSIFNQRNIMDAGNDSVYSLVTDQGGIVDIYYQKGSSLYWDEEIPPRWSYVHDNNKQKGLVGIPDISIKYTTDKNTLVMLDLKNRPRSAGNNSEEIYKMIGYFSNFSEMYKKRFTSDIKKQAILIFRNDYVPFSEELTDGEGYLLNTYSVSPSKKDTLNKNQFKLICKQVLDTQGIDGKTSEVLGNYKNDHTEIFKNVSEEEIDDALYELSERNHQVISNLFSFGNLEEELSKQMNLLEQNYFPHIWTDMDPKTKEILAMADCLFSGMKASENADYAPICLEYCRALEVQLNALLIDPFRKSHDISQLSESNWFYKKMLENREMTLGECIYFFDKCLHDTYPMTEFKVYIEKNVKKSSFFFRRTVDALRDINTNIRRLSAHTTIMTYNELVKTRQRILGIGYTNQFYVILDKR